MAEKNVEDKLSDIGGLISGIAEAVKVSKSLKDKNLDIKRIIDSTKKQTDKVNEFEIPDNPLLKDLKPPLEDVKTASQDTAASASQLEICTDSLCKDVEVFDNLVRSFRRDKDLNILQDIRASLINVQENSKNLAVKCNELFEQTQKTKKMVVLLTDKITKKKDELLAMKESEPKRVFEGFIGSAFKWCAEGIRLVGKVFNNEKLCDYGVSKMRDGDEMSQRSTDAAIHNDRLSKLSDDISQEAEKLKIIAKEFEYCEVKLATLMQEVKGGLTQEALELALKFLEKEMETSDELAKEKEKVESLIELLKAQGIQIPPHLNPSQA